MNVMTTDIIEEITDRTADVSVQKRDAVLARLMKAWESKNARTAKRAGGMSLIAVTLAACNGSSGGSSSDDSDGGDGGDGGTPPVVPPLVEPDFFILDFPTQTVTTTVFNVDGEPVSVEDALAAFAELADADLSDGDVTVENLNVVQEALGGDGEGGENVINIGNAGNEQQLSFDEFLDLIQTQDIITVGRVILTPQENSGIVFAPGFATGDQFEEGEFGTSGNPGSGDDVIFFGRTELLHSAIIDGGGGADEVVVVAKGTYAQPSAISNIETFRILNSENTTVDVLDEVEGQNILTEEDVDFQIVSTFPNFNATEDDDNTWIDLGAAFGLTSVVIGENAEVTDSNLFVVGVNNGATLVLQGGFANDVVVDYGFNFGGGTVFNLRLEDVNFDGGELLIAQNSTHLAIESTGADATVENYIEDGDFGGNLRQLTITGDKFLNIDDEVEFNDSRPITIDAGANTGGVKLDVDHDGGDSIAENLINLVGSQGDDAFTLEADAFNITSGAGSNTFNLTGTYNGPLVEGMRLVFDGSAGEDTIILNDGNNFGNGGDGPIGNDGGFFKVMLAGSSITGVENSLVVSPNTNYSLTEATLEGITSVAVAPGSSLAVTGAQVGALGAGVFSVLDADEFVASPPDAFPTVAIVLEEGDDVTLADLIDVTALDSNVKLGFRIPDNATLTLTAEELHTYVANPGILMGNDDTNPLESVGELIITNAGENFNPFFTGDVDAPGLGLLPGGGTVVGSTNNVTIDRSEGGFERPSQEPIDDTFLIDSSDGPVTVGPNDFGEDDEFTLPQDATKLVMEGANDITFTAPVSFGDTNNFIVDFEDVAGVVSGLEIVDFHNITTGIDPDDWGQVIGNGDARVDVQLDGNVGNANNGLISSGVATYVVTDLNDGDHEFWTSDPTEDLEVLGLQGNDGQIVIFGNVRNGVNFLMEGDGFASFEDVPKALEPLDESNIGTLEALFAPGSGTVSATVEVNNQGVELGAASDGGERELYVDGIKLNGAQTITVNISDGDADIGGTVVGNAGVSGSVLETLNLNSADDVTLTVDGGTSSLETLDAGGVDGTMTLSVLANGPVDLSDTTLIGIDAIEMQDDSELQLTVQQALEIGIANVSVDGAEDGNEADLTLNVTEDFDLDLLDLANLPEGLSLELSIQADATLEITGDQAVALLEAGVTIENGFDPDDGDEPGTVNITGFNQTHLDDVQDDGSVDAYPYADLFDPAGDAAILAGTITTDGSEVFVDPDYGDFFGQFGWELEGGTLGLSNPAMANELVVNNGDVQFFFTNFGGETIGATGNAGIDASDYTNIGTIFVTEFFETVIATGEFNAESIAFLDSATEIDVVPLAPLDFDGTDRSVVVGGIPFAINDDGTPFNPATGDPGPVTTGVDLLFNNVSGDENRNVETVTLAFGEGGNVIGNIEIGGGELPDGNPFETLTLISNGDDVNTVEDIFATGNTLTNVAITANEAFDAQTITLSSLDPDADGVVTITGTADVTLKAIDYSDANVDTLTVTTTGYTGTLDVTGGSPSITTGEELTFVGTADSTVLLDTADLTPPDDGNLGVDGNGELTLLDASGMAGTLALGDVANLADGFTLLGGTGVITASDVELPADNYVLDISDAAAGSSISFGGGDFVLSSGSFSLATDPVTFETTLTFGNGTTLAIDESLDLGDFDTVVFGSDVTIELGEAGLVEMTDEQFAEFEAAGGTIAGETAKTFDAGVDLQDVRGLTEINIEDEAAGTFTLSSDQVGDARIVDTDDPATDPDLPSEFGDIQALNDAIDLEIVVKEGESFAVTDNEIDNVSISGDGSVVTNIVGIAGARLTLDAVSGDNNPGQSITVDFTLDGAADSVTLNNTATNFTSPAAINAALASTLNSVDGLNASVAGGVITVQADEAGVAFGVTDVDTGDTNGADISFVSNVESTAEMAGNTVADTTHVFEALSTGGYEVNGSLGGDFEVEIEGANFIDLTGAAFPGVPLGETLSINITGTAELKLNPNDLDDLIVTGGGSVQADVAGAVSGVDLSGIGVPLQFNVDAFGASLDGATEFNPGQPLTLVGAEGVPAPGPVFDITGLDTAGDVPNLNRPSSVDLDNVDFTVTAAQADGLVVTGSSEVTVEMGAVGSDNSDLSGIGVDLEINSDADLDFGGNLPSGQPIKFSGGNTISLNGSTIPAGAAVLIAENTTLDVTGGTVGAGVTFVMETSALTITGEQADGTSIVDTVDMAGDPQAFGTVNITGLDGTEDLSGIDGPSLALTFEDDADAGSVAASAIDGQAISIEGGDPAEDFTLTITGLEDVPDADLTGLTLNLATMTDTNVEVEVDSTGDVTIGEDADLSIAAATSVTLNVTGTGTVDVEDGADLSGIGAFTVGQGSTLVTDSTLTDPNSVIDPADVTGSGTLQYVELDGGTFAANGDVRTNEFVFDSADTGVTINSFEAEVGNGFFVFDDTDPGDIILGSMRLNLSDFDTNGSDVISVADFAGVGGLGDVSGTGVIIIDDGSDPSTADLSGATGGPDSQLFFVNDNDADTDTEVQYWDDTAAGGGNGDGIVDAIELTEVASLSSTDPEDLGSANFTV